MYIVEQLNEITNHYSRILRKICSKHNITFEQGKLLLIIPYDGITMSELSYKLGLDNSTLTRNIKKIQNEELVFIDNSKIDKRKKYIILTTSGERLINKIEKDINNFFKKIKISIDKQKSVINSIEKINWLISNLDEH